MPITPSPGNWNIGPINLPDWGISEAILGPAWGNSAPANNPLVQPPAVEQRLNDANAYGPQLPPANATNYALTGNVGALPTNNPAPTNNAPGDSRLQELAKMNRNGTQEQEYQRLLAPSPTSNEAEMREVDSAYGSAMDYLSRAEQAIRGFQPQVEAGINSTVDMNTQLANTQKAQGERGIATAQTDTQSRLQNAITAARQALQESMTGGRQRFGSGSNITKALGEYGTTKFQQASGQARDSAEQTYRSLAEQTQQLSESYGNAIAQLNQWKTTQMQQAQQEFMNKLMEIDSNRNEATQNKSFQKIQLLQDMRSRADAIKTQAWTFAQNLEAQRQAYSQQLGSSINSFGQGAVSGANSAAMMGANGINSVNMSPISATGQATSASNTMTGQTTQKKYDQFGNPIQ